MRILHYALSLHFGKVCEQKASKTRAKREKNATDSHSCPTHSVIYQHFPRWARVLDFSRVFLVFLAFWIPKCWYHKHEDKREKNVRKIQNASEPTIM